MINLGEPIGMGRLVRPRPFWHWLFGPLKSPVIYESCERMWWQSDKHLVSAYLDGTDQQTFPLRMIKRIEWSDPT